MHPFTKAMTLVIKIKTENYSVFFPVANMNNAQSQCGHFGWKFDFDANCEEIDSLCVLRSKRHSARCIRSA